MNKRQSRFLSLISLILGIVFLLNSKINITGAITGAPNISSAFSTILGIALIAVSVILFNESRGAGATLVEKLDTETDATHRYYKQRTKEIFNREYNKQDIYVSRWELDGLMDYIKNAVDGQGNKIYAKSSFEHETDAPGIHPLGKYQTPHLNVSVKKMGKKGQVERHLIITDDPYDPRLKNVGVKISDGRTERVSSEVYNPQHPRSKDEIYKRKTKITYEK